MNFDGGPEIGTDLINHYLARFLFGTDEVAPKTQDKYLKIYFIFDAARVKVRAWEKAQGL